MKTMTKTLEPITEPNADDLMPSEGEAFGDMEPPKQEPTPAKETPKKRRSLEEKEPQSRAFVKDQGEKYPESLKLDRVETKVLDFNIPEQLEDYNRINTESVNPDLGLTIHFQELKFSDKTDNWKALVQVHHYKFLPIA